MRQIKIREISKKKGKPSIDDIKALTDMIGVSDDMYPGIDRWLSSKVIPGLRSGERIAYLALEDERPIAAAVLKLGASAKICHLRINEGFQDQGLGELFFVEMAARVRQIAKEIHFTLPESLWQKKHGFFRSFGFLQAKKSSHFYRKTEIELACSASISSVWSAAQQKLPGLLRQFCIEGYSSRTNIIMSVKPNFAKKLASGVKSIEIRKRFSRKWLGSEVALYASHPVRALVGKATIRRVTSGRPDAIWSQFRHRIGSTEAEFRNYVGYAEEVAAIELIDVIPFSAGVPLRDISKLLSRSLRAPQSYCELKFDSNNDWATAVHLAELLGTITRSKDSHLSRVKHAGYC